MLLARFSCKISGVHWRVSPQAEWHMVFIRDNCHEDICIAAYESVFMMQKLNLRLFRALGLAPMYNIMREAIYWKERKVVFVEFGVSFRRKNMFSSVEKTDSNWVSMSYELSKNECFCNGFVQINPMFGDHVRHWPATFPVSVCLLVADYPGPLVISPS